MALLTFENRTLSTALIADHDDLWECDVFTNIAFEKAIDFVEKIWVSKTRLAGCLGHYESWRECVVKRSVANEMMRRELGKWETCYGGWKIGRGRERESEMNVAGETAFIDPPLDLAPGLFACQTSLTYCAPYGSDWLLTYPCQGNLTQAAANSMQTAV